MAGVVDAAGDQQRGAAVVAQAGLSAEVVHDAAHDPLLAALGTHERFHVRPGLAQHGLFVVVQATGLGGEPVVDLLRRAEVLGHVAGAVLEVEHHAVADGLVELVGVDVGAEDVAGGLLVFPQQGGAGEADEDGVGEPRLQLAVQGAALGAVALVDEDVEAAVDGGRRGVCVGFDLLDE